MGNLLSNALLRQLLIFLRTNNINNQLSLKLKTFRVDVCCRWIQYSNGVERQQGITTKIYKVHATDKRHACIKAEDIASRDSSFNLGKPDEVTAIESF